MKYKLLALIFFTTIIIACKPQAEVSDEVIAFRVDKIEEQSVKAWELDDNAYDDWQRIEDDWKVNVLNPTLEKYKIKVNCSDCPRVALRVIMKIGEDGKLVAYEIVNFNVCGDKVPKGLESDLMGYFTELTFDESLNGKVFEAYLGKILKC